VSDRFSLASAGTIQPVVGEAGLMDKIARPNRRKNVLSFANERARQPRGGSNEHASLERLEAENVQLRASVVELVLQIQALRDGARRLIA